MGLTVWVCRWGSVFRGLGFELDVGLLFGGGV